MWEMSKNPRQGARERVIAMLQGPPGGHSPGQRTRHARRRLTGAQIYYARIGDRSLCGVAVPELSISIITVALEGVVVQDDTCVTIRS